MWLAALSLLSIGWSAPDADVLLKIDEAAIAFDSVAMETIIEDAEGYALGAAYFRLAAMFKFSGKNTQCTKSLNLAFDALEPLESAEAKALLAHAMGMHIEVAPMSGFRLGPDTMKLMDQARTQAPNNPRVQMFYAVHKLYLPWILGGSAEEALDAIDRSIANFQNPQEDAIKWGEPDAHVWRGIILMKMGQPQAARLAWENSLEVLPGYGRAEHLLGSLVWDLFPPDPAVDPTQVPPPLDSN